LTITPSGTKAPRLMYSDASLPNGVRSATALRKISPVEIWQAENFSSSSFA